MIVPFKPKTWMVTTWITSAKIMSNPDFSPQSRISCLLRHPYFQGGNSNADIVHKKLSPNTFLISKEQQIRLFWDSNNATAQDVIAKNRHLFWQTSKQ
jgi:hypothetical protein